MKILQKYTELMCSGIYKITNTINNKCYIGSSNVVYHRLKSHAGSLKDNKHPNKHLQSAYNLYGGTNFTAELIEKVEKKNLENREQYYMDFFKSEYNKRTAYRNSFIAQDTRNKISKTLKEKYITGEVKGYDNKPFWKKIYVFDLQGNFVKEFPCINQCERFYGISKIQHPDNNNVGHLLLRNKYILYGKRELPISVFDIKLTNIHTEEILYFYRKQDAIRELNLSCKIFYNCLYKNKIYKNTYKLEDIGTKQRKR